MPRTAAIKRGPDLIQEIRAAEIPHGRVGVWWLGQATFCFKFGRTIVYSDPFYRAEDQPPEMICETPLKPGEFVDASLICCTHEHLDHIDPETLLRFQQIRLKPLAGLGHDPPPLLPPL